MAKDTQPISDEAIGTNWGPDGARGKITLAALGDPGRVKTLSVEELAKSKGKYFLGTITGRATGFVTRTDDKKQETFEGLKGTFVALPADPERETIESGVLFIPDAFHNMVAEELRHAQKDDEDAVLEFSLEFYSIIAKNPAGYSWHAESAIKRKGKHPLADLVQQTKALQAKKHPALLAAPKR